jgi:hypothetical protein
MAEVKLGKLGILCGQQNNNNLQVKAFIYIDVVGDGDLKKNQKIRIE